MFLLLTSGRAVFADTDSADANTDMPMEESGVQNAEIADDLESEASSSPKDASSQDSQEIAQQTESSSSFSSESSSSISLIPCDPFSSSSSVSSSASSSISSISSSSQSFYSSHSSQSSSSSGNAPSNIRITEVLANPAGADDGEWIEIGNLGNTSENIAGWILKDATGKYTIEPRDESGFMLEPNEHHLFAKTLTKLSLTNTGEEVSLWNGSMRIDGFAYPETAEEISYGRDPENPDHLMPLCLPSPGTANSIADIQPAIVVQEGQLRGEGSVSVNLMAQVVQGSMSHVSCAWQYGDGFVSDSCNPPSHTFSDAGSYTVTVTMTNYCGDSDTASVLVEVTPKQSSSSAAPASQQQQSSSTSSASSSSTSHSSNTGGNGGSGSCIATAESGIRISEFLPNPVGDDAAGEWIEIENTLARSFSLYGWQIDDAGEGSSSKPFALDDYTIGTGSFLLLPRSSTKIALNNSDEHVRLIGPAGIVIDDIFYADSEEGKSYARMGSGSFVWTSTVTPGEANVFETHQAEMSATQSAGAVLGLQEEHVTQKKTASTLSTFLSSRYRSVLPEAEAKPIAYSELLTRVRERASAISAPEAVKSEKVAYGSQEKIFLIVFFLLSAFGLVLLMKKGDLLVRKPNIDKN